VAPTSSSLVLVLRLAARVALAYALTLQVLLSAMSGAAHLAAQAADGDGFTILCSGDRANAGRGGEGAHHQVDDVCCAWGCAVPDLWAPLAATLVGSAAWPNLAVTALIWPQSGDVAPAGPSTRTSRQPRAPPILT
jgi:hypothetical protein